MNASLQNLLLLANPTSHRIPSHLLLNCPTHLPLILKLSVIKSRSPQNLIRKDGLPQTYMPSTLASPQNFGVLSKRYDPNTNLDSISQSSWWSDGTPCIRSKKALVLAQHLKDNVWNSLPLPDPIEGPLAPPQPTLDTPFTMFELYRFFSVVELMNFLAVSMKQWYDTTRVLRVLLPLAENREQWVLLTPKMN